MNFLRDLPIRSKLIIIIMTVSLSTLLIAGIAIANYNIKNSKQAMVQKFTTVARLLGNRSTAALAFGDKQLANENLNSLKDSPDVVLACIYNKDGMLFSQYRSEIFTDNCAPVQVEKYDIAVFGNDFLRVRNEISLDSELLGYIYIQSELQRIRHHIREQIVIVILALCLAGIFSFFLSS